MTASQSFHLSFLLLSVILLLSLDFYSLFSFNSVYFPFAKTII